MSEASLQADVVRKECFRNWKPSHFKRWEGFGKRVLSFVTCQSNPSRITLSSNPKTFVL